MNILTRLVKTDGRHSGHELFEYFAELTPKHSVIDRFSTFYDMRVWCWEQWGPSCERDMYMVLDKRESGWAWHLSFPVCRIYFENESKASWFMMRWG